MNWVEEYRDLYLNNPVFKRMADEIIPVVLEGIATKAREWEEEQEEEIKQLMRYSASPLYSEEFFDD